MLTLHNIAETVRRNVIDAVEEGAKSLLLTPGLGNGVGKVVDALDEALAAYEALVRAAHHSSTEAFAFRDLRSEERQVYTNAKHMLNGLHRIHDQEAS